MSFVIVSFSPYDFIGYRVLRLPFFPLLILVVLAVPISTVIGIVFFKSSKRAVNKV